MGIDLHIHIFKLIIDAYAHMGHRYRCTVAHRKLQYSTSGATGSKSFQTRLIAYEKHENAS